MQLAQVPNFRQRRPVMVAGVPGRDPADYRSVSLGASAPVLGEVGAGINVTGTVDRFGRVYVGMGPGGGAGPGVSAVDGYLDQPTPATEEQLQNFIPGSSDNISAGAGMGVGRTSSPAARDGGPQTTATEIGFVAGVGGGTSQTVEVPVPDAVRNALRWDNQQAPPPVATPPVPGNPQPSDQDAGNLAQGMNGLFNNIFRRTVPPEPTATPTPTPEPTPEPDATDSAPPQPSAVEDALVRFILWGLGRE